MRLRRKMIAASGPGWAVVDADGKVLPGRWGSKEDAQNEGNLGVYLISGIGVVETPLKWKRSKVEGTMWQITGYGELRHEVFGTVEKVYGGWFAVTAHGEERSCTKLSEGAQWIAEQWEARR